VQPAGSDGLTVYEWELALGWTHSRTDTIILRLFRAGRIVCGRALRQARDGTTRWVPVYRLKA